MRDTDRRRTTCRLTGISSVDDELSSQPGTYSQLCAHSTQEGHVMTVNRKNRLGHTKVTFTLPCS